MHKLGFFVSIVLASLLTIDACDLCYYNGVPYSCGSNIGVDPKFICCNGNWQQCDSPSYCKCRYDEQFENPSYRIVGIDNQNSVVDNCSFPCYESNCSKVALRANNCPDVSWVAFVSSYVECSLFNKQTFSVTNYTVFAVDDERNIIDDSLQIIPNYFNYAVNYGCALLTLWPDAIWFGMVFDSSDSISKPLASELISKPLASCYAECQNGYCSIDCPPGHAAYCYCVGGTAPKCTCN
jgi:hypothetical protein